MSEIRSPRNGTMWLYRRCLYYYLTFLGTKNSHTLGGREGPRGLAGLPGFRTHPSAPPLSN